MTAFSPFVAEIGIAGFNFAPRGWALCNGQLLPISQNTALFSLLGTTYGGDGKSTFGLPDLQGRVAIHPGQGPGLSLYDQGQTGGSETQTLPVLPLHTHTGEAASGGNLTQQVSTLAGTSANPDGRVPAATGTDQRYAPTANATMAPYNLSTQPAGQAQPAPFSVLQPYLTLTYCIALQGIFPPRP